MLSNDVSFVIFGHQTWDLEGGGGKLTPTHSISWFSTAEKGLMKGLEKLDYFNSKGKIVPSPNKLDRNSTIGIGLTWLKINLSKIGHIYNIAVYYAVF